MQVQHYCGRSCIQLPLGRSMKASKLRHCARRVTTVIATAVAKFRKSADAGSALLWADLHPAPAGKVDEGVEVAPLCASGYNGDCDCCCKIPQVCGCRFSIIVGGPASSSRWEGR